MGSSEDFKQCLQVLAQESGNSKDFRSLVEDLIKLHRNILQNPENEKFCRINLSSKLMQGLWKYKGANLFLTRVGWQQERDSLHLKHNGCIKPALQALQDVRLIAPEASEWIGANKVENLTKHIVREEKMRADAAKDRDRELQKFYADEKEKKELAANIKKQIKADAEARKLKPLHAAVKSKSTGSIASKNAGQAAVKRFSTASTVHKT